MNGADIKELADALSTVGILLLTDCQIAAGREPALSCGDVADLRRIRDELELLPPAMRASTS
jgi:hypothetical protein